MKASLKHLLLVVLFSSVVACQPQDLKKAMVHFDQAFIPVLMAVDQGDIYKAKSAVFYLEFRWQKLNNQYGNLLPENEDWQEAFRRVNGWLGDAYFAIDNNNPQLAANQLGHVKYELMELRRLHGVDYYLDDLFDLQVITDKMINVINDDKLELLQWNEFERLVVTARKGWNGIMNKPIDFQEYELDKAEVAQFHKTQQTINALFNNLTQGVECADQAVMAQHINQLGPAIDEMIALFGNFGEDRTFFAQRNLND